MEYQKLFDRLNEKLAAQNLTLSLHCVGGFVLEYHGLKATEDIDAFYESSDKIEQIIAEIGQEFDVGTNHEAWLNHSIGQLMSNPYRSDEIIYNGSNLTVGLASLKEVLVDKIQAGREKDVSDIAEIMKKLNLTSPDEILELMKYSDGNAELAVIFEAYGLAYGAENLKKYLTENPEMLRLLK